MRKQVQRGQADIVKYFKDELHLVTNTANSLHRRILTHALIGLLMVHNDSASM